MDPKAVQFDDTKVMKIEVIADRSVWLRRANPDGSIIGGENADPQPLAPQTVALVPREESQPALKRRHIIEVR